MWVGILTCPTPYPQDKTAWKIPHPQARRAEFVLAVAWGDGNSKNINHTLAFQLAPCNFVKVIFKKKIPLCSEGYYRDRNINFVINLLFVFTKYLTTETLFWFCVQQSWQALMWNHFIFWVLWSKSYVDGKQIFGLVIFLAWQWQSTGNDREILGLEENWNSQRNHYHHDPNMLLCC